MSPLPQQTATTGTTALSSTVAFRPAAAANQAIKTEDPHSPVQPLRDTSTTSTATHAQISHMMSRLLPDALHENPKLLPDDPSKEPITSAHINDIAHAMWQAAFRHGGMLQRACQYAALFSRLKLAALAKLNFLPSWWFFRGLVVRDVGDMGEGWVVDDAEMEQTWLSSVRWCAGVLGDRVGKGKAAAAVKVADGGVVDGKVTG